MPTTQLQKRVSKQQLLKAAGRLKPKEFEEFASEIATLKARRRTPYLASDESKLLAIINRGLPERQWKRVDELRAKLEAETLTSKERQELSRFSERLEAMSVTRLKALIDLAAIRKTTVETLMEDLGISPRAHG